MSEPGEFFERVDPSRPFTMASDVHNNSIHLHFVVPPFLATALGDLAADPHTELKRMSDVLRDAAYQYARWWHQKLGSESPPSLTVGMALASAEIRAANRRRDDELIKKLEEEERVLDPRRRDDYIADVLIARASAPPDMQDRVERIMQHLGIEDL